MKTPTHAKLLLGQNCKYPIEKIHFKTQQVTLRESEKVYNTVSIKSVEFDFSDFTEAEIMDFQGSFIYKEQEE
ncbi:hypothetical protein [Bacteroides acidifaciens]|uniref:hypothetical protein n=1 Tax=Bacteroides acidifaciens TaxID=85831 RepID=UPI0026090D14|nr:hypothetical protein [Bacteroides acidifaciens]